MVGYYRLKDTGFRLAAGAHILPKEAFEPVEAATALLDEARAVAAGIVEDARRIYQQERERGYQEGLAAARMEAAGRLLEEGALLDRKLAETESELTEVVVAGVRALVHGFDDGEKAAILVRAALRQMRREKKAELRVSPQQYEEMRAAIGGIIAEFPEVELVDVVEDATLAPPRIVMETAIGRVEGDLGRNLDELERTIRAATARASQAEAEMQAEAAQ